jgi:hypothetical protein
MPRTSASGPVRGRTACSPRPARADSERAAAARARARGQASRSLLTARAERRATVRRELAEQRMPGYVGRVVAMVRTAGEEAVTTGRGDLR